MSARRLLTSLGVGFVLVVVVGLSFVAFTVSSGDDAVNPLPAPDCGTAEDRVKSSDISLEDAAKLVEACLAADTAGLVSPTPGSDGGTVTFPLEEPVTLELADGKEVMLPSGVGIGRILGLGDYTFISLHNSRIYFETETWKPVFSELTYVHKDDRAELKGIVDQLSEGFPEYQSEYQTLTGSYLKADLPEQSPVKTPIRPN